MPPLPRAALPALLALACGVESPRPATAAAPQPEPAAPAVAAPAPPAGPDYETALRAGRAAFEAKDFAAAVTSFEQALARAPDDARALSELGWAALHADDLPMAERVLLRAIEVDADDRLRAASLYNLGRVREAQGRGLDAVPLYERSLGLRDSRTVRARLGRVRATPAKVRLDIDRLDGPHPTIDDWCTARPAGPARACDAAFAGRPGLVLEQPALPAGADLLEARFVTTQEPEGEFIHHHLAIRVASGWFVRPDVGLHGDGIGNVHFTLSQLSFAPVELVPEGGTELLVRIDEDWLDLDMGDDVAHQERHGDRIVCGVGPSGRPACTSRIPLTGILRELPGNGEGPARSEQRWKMSLRVGDRAIVLTDASVDEAHRAWLGTHRVALP